MDPSKIDRLFRENLYNVEVNPSEESWNEVERSLKHAKKPSFKVYWIAATVSLVIVTWVIWPNNHEHKLQITRGSIDHPTIEKHELWELANNDIKNIGSLTRSETRADTSQKETTNSRQKDTTTGPSHTPFELLNTRKSMAGLNIAELSSSELALKTIPTGKKSESHNIKITYIASSQEATQKTDSTKIFKKLWAFAGKLTPGDVLADIRAAKDDFINNGFKSKEKDRSSL